MGRVGGGVGGVGGGVGLVGRGVGRGVVVVGVVITGGGDGGEGGPGNYKKKIFYM